MGTAYVIFNNRKEKESESEREKAKRKLTIAKPESVKAGGTR